MPTDHNFTPIEHPAMRREELLQAEIERLRYERNHWYETARRLREKLAEARVASDDQEAGRG